jgi:hypothetical protein
MSLLIEMDKMDERLDFPDQGSSKKRPRPEDKAEQASSQTKTKKKRKSLPASAPSSVAPPSDSEGVEASEWAPVKQVKQKKGKGKEKEKEKIESEKETEDDESEESEDEPFIIVPKRKTAPPPRWIPPKDLQTSPSFFQDHEEPFSSIQGSPEEKAAAIQALVSQGRGPILVATWGKGTTGRSIALAKEAVCVTLGKPSVEHAVIGPDATWLIIFCGSKKKAREVVEQQAMLHSNGVLVFFRELRRKPYHARTVGIECNAEEFPSRLNVMKVNLPQAIIESLGRPTNQEVEIVKITMRDDNHAMGYVFKREVIGKGWKSRVVKSPHCIGCHSEDHYETDCRWKMLNVNYPLRPAHYRKRIYNR